jgi:hypothetical protein
LNVQLEIPLGIDPIPGINFEELSLRGMAGTVMLIAYLFQNQTNGSARILTTDEIDDAVRRIPQFSHLKSWRRRLREIRELSIKRWGAKPNGRPVREIYEVKFTQRNNPQVRFLMPLGEIWSLVQEANHQNKRSKP